jgi:hypothetical protein
MFGKDLISANLATDEANQIKVKSGALQCFLMKTLRGPHVALDTFKMIIKFFGRILRGGVSYKINFVCGTLWWFRPEQKGAQKRRDNELI